MLVVLSILFQIEILIFVWEELIGLCKNVDGLVEDTPISRFKVANVVAALIACAETIMQRKLYMYKSVTQSVNLMGNLQVAARETRFTES